MKQLFTATVYKLHCGETYVESPDLLITIISIKCFVVVCLIHKDNTSNSQIYS